MLIINYKRRLPVHRNLNQRVKTFQETKWSTDGESSITWAGPSRPSVVRPLGPVAMERHPISLLWAGSGVLSRDWLSEAAACQRRAEEERSCCLFLRKFILPSLFPSSLPLKRPKYSSSSCSCSSCSWCLWLTHTDTCTDAWVGKLCVLSSGWLSSAPVAVQRNCRQSDRQEVLSYT